jgi:hypothetical protein
VSYDELDDNVQLETSTEVRPAADANAIAIRASIGKVQEAIAELDAIGASLPEIEARHPIDLVFDVSTGKGMVEAVAHRAAWREPRLAVERYRKQAKGPVLVIGKQIDSRAAWLTERLLRGEEPVAQQIRVEEARKAQEKADREAKEFGRIVAMQEAIAEIAMSAMVAGKSSVEIAARLDSMKATRLDPLIYQEMMPQAQEARIAAIAKMEQALKAAQWDEAEAARRAAEAEATRVKQAAEDAERARVSAEQRAEAARLAEARALIAKAEREAAETLEKERKEFAAQKAAWLAEQEAARKATAPAPTAPEPVAEAKVAPEPAIALYARPAPVRGIERYVDEYIDGYVMEGDDGCYTPSDHERFLIKDAIMGLLADDEFLAMLERGEAAA